ncbi:unnamed protein product, partial [Mesorhabditis belari]|uniref:Uncharacterized protein n=1 Tax=Mesorhabditis belari TaxID=2138241 RepID=A0AAF3JB02_9BILA
MSESLWETIGHYGDPDEITQFFWGASRITTCYGIPCTFVLTFLCGILIRDKSLRKEYENTITFMSFACFILGTPIVWYNVTIFLGMQITNGDLKFTLFTCTLFKMIPITMWYCSFLVPSVVALNRYLLIVRGHQTNLKFSLRILFSMWTPMLIVDSMHFLIGVPTPNDTCTMLLYLKMDPVPQLYTLYVFSGSASGIVLNTLTYKHIKKLASIGKIKADEKQIFYSCFLQSFVPFFAIFFLMISNFAIFTGLFTVPIWFTRPANIYAVIGSTLLIPLIGMFMVR